MADLEQNGGLSDVFGTSEQWTDQLSDRRRKKRKAQNSKGSSSDNKIDIEKFKTLNTDEKLSALFTKFDNNNEHLTALESKMNQCLQISSDIRNNKTRIDNHETRLLLSEYKSVDLEARSRRKNLLFSGFTEERDENCVIQISNFLRESLGIQSEVCIDRAHRLGRFKRDQHRQIIIAFRDFSDVQLILSKAYKLKGSKYSINRDYPQEIVNARKSLWKEYKSLKSNNPDKRVHLVYPAKILMDGRVVSDAFPLWGEVMNGQRINCKHSSVKHTQYTSCDSRAADYHNTPTRNTSRSSVSSEEALPNSQSRTLPRRESRSPNRRGRARSPHRHDHYRSNQTVDSDKPAKSQSKIGNDPNIRRPWDSTGDAQTTTTA